MGVATLFYDGVDFIEDRIEFYRQVYEDIKNDNVLLDWNGRGIWENEYYEKRLILSEYKYKIYSNGIYNLKLKMNIYEYETTLPYAIELMQGVVSYETCIIFSDLISEDKLIVYSLVSDISNYMTIVAYELAYYWLRHADNPEQIMALSLLGFPVYKNDLVDDLRPIYGTDTQKILDILRTRREVGNAVKSALSLIQQSSITAMEWDDLVKYFRTNNPITNVSLIANAIGELQDKVQRGTLQSPYIQNLNYRGSSRYWYLLDQSSGLVIEGRFSWKFNGKSLDYTVDTQTNYIPKYIINLRPYKERLTTGDKNTAKKLMLKAVNCSNRHQIEAIFKNIKNSLAGKVYKKKLYRIYNPSDTLGIGLDEIMQYPEIQLSYNLLKHEGGLSITGFE